MPATFILMLFAAGPQGRSGRSAIAVARGPVYQAFDATIGGIVPASTAPAAARAAAFDGLLALGTDRSGDGAASPCDPPWMPTAGRAHPPVWLQPQSV